jgi:hypothetical protein
MKPEERRAHASGLLRQVRQRLIEYRGQCAEDDPPECAGSSAIIDGSATDIRPRRGEFTLGGIGDGCNVTNPARSTGREPAHRP